MWPGVDYNIETTPTIDWLAGCITAESAQSRKTTPISNFTSGVWGHQSGEKEERRWLDIGGEGGERIEIRGVG